MHPIDNKYDDVAFFTQVAKKCFPFDLWELRHFWYKRQCRLRNYPVPLAVVFAARIFKQIRVYIETSGESLNMQERQFDGKGRKDWGGYWHLYFYLKWGSFLRCQTHSYGVGSYACIRPRLFWWWCWYLIGMTEKSIMFKEDQLQVPAVIPHHVQNR